MQTESFDAGRDLATEAQAAAAILGQRAEQCESAWPDSMKDFIPRTTAMNGLAAAILVASFLWMLIGAIFWLMAR
jgi:hypothetical protein